MTIFELVKLALDELYSEAGQTYKDKVDEEIRKRLVYLSASYGNLTDPGRTPLNYKDPATRFAYVFKYVTAHADYIVQGLKTLRRELGGNIFGNGNARVSCIGGGPGSDIIAVLRYLDEYSHQETIDKITCYLLDKEQAWADTWTELNTSLKMKVQPSTAFQPLDVADPECWKYQRKFLQADLFTLSYFVSEVFSLGGKVTAFWRELFGSARPGALFVYTDNGSDVFNDYFRQQSEASGLEEVICCDNIEMTPSYTEEKSVLAKYTDKFGHMPKLKSIMTLRVLKKP